MTCQHGTLKTIDRPTLVGMHVGDLVVDDVDVIDDAGELSSG